ncbi:MAG: response regulator transcription factor [Acetobacteraceae bacterium]|nr:response regulator transcription factor [Acetobacteraceae bacterium]
MTAERTETGEEALELVRHYDFDLLILSLTFPDLARSTVIRRIRAAGRRTPILALSGLRNPRARVEAFAAGADDVVDQNVDSAELLARIRAIVRRSRGHSQSSLRIGAVTLDLELQTVVANGTSVPLTGKEFAVLQLLMLRKNMVLTKEAILTQLYGGMDEPELKIIDVFVCKLRKKLAAVGLSDFVGTVWGCGYTVRDQGADRADPAIPSMPAPTDASRRLVSA